MPPHRREPCVHTVATGAQEIASDQIKQIFKPGVERRIARLLHTDIDSHSHRIGRDNHRDSGFGLIAIDIGRRQPS